MVEYFSMDGVDGKYFKCARYGTMSVSSCARNYASAPTVVRTGRLDGCIGCKVGQCHSGEPLKVKENKHAVVYRQVCVRCRRDPGADTSRLIGRQRLVRDKTICVSCYNREREVLAGANAKGAPPRKWSGLYHGGASYVRDSRLHVERMVTPVVDRAEMMLTILRRVGSDVAFTWSCPPRIMG